MSGRKHALAIGFHVTVSLAVTALCCAQDTDVTAVRIASGLQSPVYVTSPPGDNDRLFIVEQFSSSTEGRIRILNLNTGQINPTPFLTIGGLATDWQDYGLLGLTFHPDYAHNGFFYVNLMPTGGDRNEVRRYQVSGTNPDIASPASATDVLTYFQTARDHNGGWLGFGPDGYLYVPTGDGGPGTNDPGNAGQDITNQLLGKILRLDIDGDDFPGDPGRNYAIPNDNPFVGRTGDDEIWSYGLRHPWRNSFDRLTGDFYIGDVGQNTLEEINVQPASSTGGENYGWRLREGTIATPTGGVGGGRPAGAIDPIYEYEHGVGDNEGFAVVGGYVYRGPLAGLQGNYFFGDFVTGNVWSVRYDGSEPNGFDGTNFTDFIIWTDLIAPDGGSIDNISSFGEDNAGNLYILDYADGEIYVLNTPPAERIWARNASGDWNSSGNWNGGGSPNSNVQSALFGSAITLPRTIFSETVVTVKVITFDNANAYVIMGNGAVNLDTDVGDAEINVLRGAHQFQLPVHLHDDTKFNIAGNASLLINNVLDLNGNTLSKLGSGMLEINNELLTEGGGIELLGGTVSGMGSVSGNFRNAGGILSPGNSPGQFVIDGDYTQGPDGTIFIEIAGRTAVTEYDVVMVSGAANLAGVLEIKLLEEFAPLKGDTFEILQFGSLNGNFERVLLPKLEAGRWWDASELLTNGRLSVVPEPGTFVLVLVCGLLIGYHEKLRRFMLGSLC